MRNTIEQEFVTVDLIQSSKAVTKHVDAFCLTWIKFERQLRKMMANIIYQATVFPESDEGAKEALRKALLERTNLKYDRFIGGIRKLSGHNMNYIIGDRYRELKKAVDQAYDFRNKIFHGQQTGRNLKESQLASSYGHVRDWCTILAEQGTVRFGYDGFTRNSLHKTYRKDVMVSVDKAIADEGWEAFVKRF